MVEGCQGTCWLSLDAVAMHCSDGCFYARNINDNHNNNETLHIFFSLNKNVFMLINTYIHFVWIKILMCIYVCNLYMLRLEHIWIILGRTELLNTILFYERNLSMMHKMIKLPDEMLKKKEKERMTQIFYGWQMDKFKMVWWKRKVKICQQRKIHISITVGWFFSGLAKTFLHTHTECVAHIWDIHNSKLLGFQLIFNLRKREKDFFFSFIF